ncbi:MAG TPA: hypothetical protein VMS96_12615 [Terriglobales bacterium]|nr:hypothetical protein [Terriglobales bacterium]
MRNAVIALLGLVLVVGPAVAQTQDAAPSTAEERKQIGELSKKLEQNPLDRSLTKDTRRLFQRIIDVPDITVTLCNDVMPWLREDYKYAPELSMTYTFGAAAYVIEHPAADPGTSSWAGLESALRGYQNLVKRDPKAKSRLMERALDQRDLGTLEPRVKDACGPEKQRL